MPPPIGKLKTELSLDSRKFNKGSAAARKEIGGFTKSLGGMKAGLVGVFGVAAVSSFVRNALRQADAIGKFSDRIGISTTALQEWRFAFDKAGLSAEEVDKGLLNFIKNLGEARQGTGTLVTFLKKYDNSLLEVLLSQEDNTSSLKILFTALGKTKNQADKVALANAALGRSGKLMVSAFKEGTASFEAWIERGRELGVVMDEDVIRNAEKLNDEVSAVTTAIRVKLQTAFIQSTPIILDFAEALATALVALNEFLTVDSSKNFDSIDDAIKREKKKLKSLQEAARFAVQIPGLDISETERKIVRQVQFISNLIRLKKLGVQPEGGEVSLKKSLPELKQKDSGIETLFEKLEREDTLEKKRQANFGKEFERKKQQVLLEKQITKELEREIKLLTIQATGNKELFALKEKQFALEDRLGRKLSENESLKLQASIAEAERLQKLVRANEDTGRKITEVWEAVGRRTEDALVNALIGAQSAMEGFRNVALAILEDITRQIIRTSIITPLFSGGGGSGGLISAAGSLFAGFFANGGSFTVPGSGGTDSTPVSFMATPGERVDVRTPGQVGDAGKGQGVTIVQNIETGVSQTVRAEMMQLVPQIIEQAKRGVFDANRRGGEFSRV